LEKLIFVVYLVGILAIINITPFFKNAGLEKKTLSGLFGIKVLAGIAYGLFYTLPKYATGADTWRFYRLSIGETRWLLKDPITFVKDLFVFGYSSAGGLFAGENSYWNDLKSNLFVKLLACANIFTGSSYYADIVLFNFIFFVGLIALYRVLNDVFPGKKILLIIGLFLLPSTLFWCSGIHKDGLILSSLGLIVYCFYKGLKNRFTAGKIICIIICFLLVFGLRNYVAIATVPALFCWYLASKKPGYQTIIFATVYLSGIVAFFSAKYLSPKLNFPKYIVEKQAEFAKLPGTSTVQLHTLQPTATGFVRFLPDALDMAFFRPHLTEAKSLSYIPADLENILLLLVVVLALVTGRKKDLRRPVILFCLFFSLSLLLLAGYTITLSGAIVRYKSISLPLLVTPILCIIHLKKNKKEFAPR
jgi:hypothetical protein